MPDIHEQPDLLRALGRMLDALQAREIEVIFHEGFYAHTVAGFERPLSAAKL